MISYSDYYPFGSIMPMRSSSLDKYRYGFNGQEKENSVNGSYSTTSAEFWMYDGRLGRRWEVDPLTALYPWQSPYATFNNNPIRFSDYLGLEGEEEESIKKQINYEASTWLEEVTVVDKMECPSVDRIPAKPYDNLPGYGRDMVLRNGPTKPVVVNTVPLAFEILKAQITMRLIAGETIASVEQFFFSDESGGISDGHNYTRVVTQASATVNAPSISPGAAYGHGTLYAESYFTDPTEILTHADEEILYSFTFNTKRIPGSPVEVRIGAQYVKGTYGESSYYMWMYGAHGRSKTIEDEKKNFKKIEKNEKYIPKLKIATDREVYQNREYNKEDSLRAEKSTREKSRRDSIINYYEKR